MAIKKFKNIKNDEAHSRMQWHKWSQRERETKSQTIYSINFFRRIFRCLYYQCLSCLIVKCMLLTFIFNYFSFRRLWRLCAVARWKNIFLNLESRIPSSCTRWIDILCLHIHLPASHKHTRARTEKKHKEILFLPERGSGESRSTVFTWKYGRTSWTCVGSSLFLSVEGKHFLITLTPPKEVSSFVPIFHPPQQLREIFVFLRDRKSGDFPFFRKILA